MYTPPTAVGRFPRASKTGKRQYWPFSVALKPMTQNFCETLNTQSWYIWPSYKTYKNLKLTVAQKYTHSDKQQTDKQTNDAELKCLA